MSTKTLLTSDDLWKTVADGSRYELSKGELVPMTPVGWRHGAIVIKLARMLGDYIEKRNLGNISTEVGFRLSRNPDTVRAPDVAFVAKARIPAGALSEKFVEFPPDLAAEVLSPEDTAREILRKVEEYLAAGVPLVWVLDPGTQTVTVYCSLQDVKILSADQELDGAGAIPGFKVQVSEIFAI
jgi:Uma2 family endonuclease